MTKSSKAKPRNHAKPAQPRRSGVRRPSSPSEPVVDRVQLEKEFVEEPEWCGFWNGYGFDQCKND